MQVRKLDKTLVLFSFPYKGQQVMATLGGLQRIAFRYIWPNHLLWGHGQISSILLIKKFWLCVMVYVNFHRYIHMKINLTS
jgi:hypothetical protein